MRPIGGRFGSPTLPAEFVVLSMATKIRRWLAQLLDHLLLHGFWN